RLCRIDRIDDVDALVPAGYVQVATLPGGLPGYVFVVATVHTWKVDDTDPLGIEGIREIPHLDALCRLNGDVVLAIDDADGKRVSLSEHSGISALDVI